MSLTALELMYPVTARTLKKMLHGCKMTTLNHLWYLAQLGHK